MEGKNLQMLLNVGSVILIGVLVASFITVIHAALSVG
jgi:hypothetical protein